MAGWKMVPDEQADSCGKVNRSVEVNEVWVDVEACKAKSLFDRFVKVVWEETGSDSGVIRPLPPRLGDGMCVYLFRVFLAVRERGGCKVVSECGLWNLIGERCGLGCGVGGSLKLIYVKYLDVLERWLDQIAESKSLEGDLVKRADETGRLLSELEEDLECLLKIIVDEKKKNSKGSILNLLMNGDSGALLIKTENKTTKNPDEDVDIVDCMMCSEVMHVESGDRENLDESSLNLNGNSGSEVRGIQVDSNGSKADIAKKPDDEVNNMNGADDEVNNMNGANDDIMIRLGANNEDSASQKKRKRESLIGMLNWLIETAKRPCDPVTGSLPDKSKWKGYGKEVLWRQVLSAREELFFKQKFDSKADQEFWLRRPMIPSMYEGRVPERPRSSRKPGSANKSQRPDGVGDSSQTNEDSDESDRPLPRIGKKYQADLPEWDSSTPKSDVKWLGTKIWPLEKTEKRKFYERVPAGRGRQDECGCPVPGSVECVRFHISEKGARLKPELGSAFHYWKFDIMGENAACSWTAEEENKFQTIVKEYHQTNELWDKLNEAFPARNRAALVSYYFNVFLIRHRANQNRHTPHHIDSDIDSEPASKVIDAEISQSSIYYSPKKQKKSTR